MKYFLCSILLPLLCQIGIAQSSVELWNYDIDFFQTEISRKHFNFFANLSKEEFDSDLKQLKADLPKMSDVEIALSLQKIICKAKDSHSGVQYSKLTFKEPVFPIFSVYWFEDGIYILVTVKGQEKLLGKKILAINDIPVEEVIKRLEALYVADNESQIRKNAPWMLNSYAVLSFMGIVKNNRAKFTLADENGKEMKVVLRTTLWEKDKENFVKFVTEGTPFAYDNKVTWFWQEYFPKEEILYVQYNNCTSREMKKKYFKDKNPAYPSFKDFSKQLLKDLKKKKVKKFVFDMRHNGGGSSLQGTQLVNKIAALDHINGKQKIYVVTGRRTYSSALLNTLDFQEKTDAIIIGEATSGKPNHFGEVRSFVLPNSKLKVYYSTKYFKRLEEDIPSVVPDIPIKRYFKDYKEGRDPIWEYLVKQ